MQINVSQPNIFSARPTIERNFIERPPVIIDAEVRLENNAQTQPVIKLIQQIESEQQARFIRTFSSQSSDTEQRLEPRQSSPAIRQYQQTEQVFFQESVRLFDEIV
jgi:hypothetical protein